MKGNIYFNFATYQETTAYLQDKLPSYLKSPILGIVCGSGLGNLVDIVTSPQEFSYSQIPHFIQSTVKGHAGKLVFGLINDLAVVVMLGRLHTYEGHEVYETTYPIRIMKLLGCKDMIVTNAAGGLNSEYKIGDFMIIKDHISFAGMGGRNSLIGPNMPEFGPRFPAVSEAYDFDLRLVACKVAKALTLDNLQEGIYTFVAGPSFETRAEARFIRDGLKGDCVGMSTVPEVIVAKHCGLRILGLSLITNKVPTGFGTSSIEHSENSEHVHIKEVVASHEEVLATSQDKSLLFTRFVHEIIKAMY